MTKAADECARQNLAKKYIPGMFRYSGESLNKMIVRQISAKEARPYIATFHYSKTMPDSTRFCYGGYLNGVLCGIVCYGMGAGKAQYTALFPDIRNGQYIELTRLWSPDDMPKNTESKLIAESLKLLPPEIKVVLSFSDEAQQHCGIIYQATNWHYVGKNGGGRMLIGSDGIKKHPRLLGIYRKRHKELADKDTEYIRALLGYEYTEGGCKHKYVFLRGNKKERKELFKLIQSKIQPYPKTTPTVERETEANIVEEILTSQEFVQLCML